MLQLLNSSIRISIGIPKHLKNITSLITWFNIEDDAVFSIGIGNQLYLINSIRFLKFDLTFVYHRLVYEKLRHFGKKTKTCIKLKLR